TISDGTVMIDAEHGIIAYHDNVTISGGTVTIDAKNGIYAGNVVRFTGGSLDITCYGLPVKAVNGIEIDDALLPDGVTIEQKDGSYILVSESGTSIRIGSGAAATNYFGKVIRSMQTISFPGVPELDGLWRAFGSTINLTKITPEPRDGYTFTGWYADEACTKPITKIVVTGNMQLFAGWEEIAEEEEAEETGTAEAAG
ncbi:MAG: InlB B-repeat-containing protein, partial [Clostridia bacterium]|nr:InlB B-repeat-containing protein [Clostridia bacterium]